MTEKYSFVNKLFLPINISDFSLFFMQKLQPPYLEKEHSYFIATPSKNLDPVKASAFENLVGGSTSPTESWRVHTMFAHLHLHISPNLLQSK